MQIDRRLLVKSVLSACAVMVLSSPLMAKEVPEKSVSKSAAEKMAVAGAELVEFKTSLGDFTVELNSVKAPKTVANFLEYARDDFYKGTIFHRVIKGFMIQGGGFDQDMHEKATRNPIPLEANNGLKNLAGTIAMARTGDPNSATSQFFINTVDNPSLDAPNPDGYGYAVFGKVITGMATVKKIEAVGTGTKNGFPDVPNKPIIINSVTLLKSK